MAITESKAESATKQLYKDQTCFRVKIATPSQEASKFKNWKGVLEASDAELHDDFFANSNGSDPEPVLYKEDLHGFKWVNESTFCTNKLPIKDGIILKAYPKLFKESLESTLMWGAI